MKPKKMMMKLIRIGLGITVFSIIFLLNSCGHKKKPTGGEKDTISPKILSFYPPEFSQLNNSLEILFSKPIEKSTVFEGISIYPPILKKKLIWSDNLLHIKILEPLKDSTNYFFKFSSSIKGIHQNPLDKNYTAIYYNGVLQNYSIYGTISYEKEEDKNKKITLSLFDSDSSLVFIKKISGVNYKLDYLNPDEYHIQAFIDRNGNNKYDFEKEPYAAITVTDSNNTQANLSMSYADTTKPHLTKIVPISNIELIAHFSENISMADEISVESADSNKVALKVITSKLKNDFITIITEKQDTTKYLLKIKNITDLKENITKMDSLYFNSSTISDTISPKVLEIYPQNGAVIKSHYPEIKLTFSELIKNIDVKLYNNETNKEYELKAIKSDKDVFEYTTQKILLNYSSYKLIVNALDYAGNKSKIESNFIVMEEK